MNQKFRLIALVAILTAGSAGAEPVTTTLGLSASAVGTRPTELRFSPVSYKAKTKAAAFRKRELKKLSRQSRPTRRY